MCLTCTSPPCCISVSPTLLLVSVPYAPAIEVAWARFPHVLPRDVSSDGHHVGCVPLSRSLEHYIMCLSAYSIIVCYNCMGTVYCLPSTSMVVRMPQHRCHSRSSSSWGADPSAVWLLTLFFFAGLLNHSCSWSVYIMCGCVPLFYTILSCCRSKH